MLTLFRAATLEDWTDLMYLNFYGCNFYSHVYVQPDSFTPDNKREWCASPVQNAVLSPVFWVTFVVVSALVMLSLFIGAVTMSMTESMEVMKEEEEEVTRQRMKEKQMKKRADASRVKELTGEESASDLKANGEGHANGAEHKAKQHRPTFLGSLGFGEDLHEKEQEMAEMTNLLVNIWDGANMEDLAGRSDREEVTGGLFRTAYHKLAVFMKRVADAGWFQTGVIAVILLAGALVGLQTDKKFEADNLAVLTVLDQTILRIFIAEIAVKILAEDAYPFRFFRSSWNCFDLLIVSGSVALAGAAGGALQMLRLLRLLRVLKLVKAFPQLQVIVNALGMGLSSIGFIGIILVLVFYMLAILGMMLFKENDPWHFGSLQLAMLTLFRCATLEDWTDVMYINMYGCHRYGYGGWMEALCTNPHPLEGENWLSAGYFVFFTLIGSLVLLTLFIGVVSTSMDEASAQQHKEMEVEETIKVIAVAENLTEQDIETFKKVFSMLDLDGSGSIEEEELRVGLQSVGRNPTDEEMERMMHDVDEDESGEIDPAEFVQFMVNTRKADQAQAASKKEKGEGERGGKAATSATAQSSPDDSGKSLSPVSPGGNNGSGVAGEGGVGGMSFMAPPPGSFQTLSQIQVTTLTPLRHHATTTGTVGAALNFGLPVLRSPGHEGWQEMSIDVARSNRRKLPKIGGGARIAP